MRNGPALTALLNSTTEGLGGFSFRPTSTERALGRFMRAPDHDAGSAGEGGGEGGDAGSSGDADDAGSIIGQATAGDGTGDVGGADAGADAGADDKGADDKAGKGDEGGAEPEGPPETYELTMPEGVDLDASLLEDATPVLKDLGLTNEAANKLLPLVGKIQEKIATAQADEFSAVSAQWAKDAKADPELGGQNWTVTTQNVARAMDHFVGPASSKNDKGEDVPNGFRKLLDDTRLGNHPDLIRAFNKIGAAMGEDPNFARSGLSTPEKKSREAVMYPNDVPTK